MRTRIPLGWELIRAAVSLVVLGCLLVGGTVFGQPVNGPSAISDPGCALPSVVIVVAGTCDGGMEKAILTSRVEISAQYDFEFAIEDDVSVEMIRPDVPEGIAGIDRAVVRPKDISKDALEARPNISSPLLE